MAIHYRLQPPFLVVPEKQDFSDAWEFFCAKLLKLDKRTDEIYVRAPPESGVDLWYPAVGIAYQCKSVESGKAGDFSVTKAVASHQAALTIQGTLGWTRYSVCTNVTITGNSEATLRKQIPSVEILPESYWIGLCERHAEKVERNFRRILYIPPEMSRASIREYVQSPISSRLIDALDGEPFDIFVYTNRNEALYRLGVSKSLTVSDLLTALRAMFRLPKPAVFESEEISVSLTHMIKHDGSNLVLSESTLGEVGIGPGSVITYWTGIRWQDEQGDFDTRVIHMATADSMRRALRSKQERADAAMEAFRSMIRQRFEVFDQLL